MFKETKLLLYFRIENHGYVTKNDITYTKQIIFAVISETFFLFNSVNTSKSKKLSATPNSFWELGSRVPPLFPALCVCPGSVLSGLCLSGLCLCPDLCLCPGYVVSRLCLSGACPVRVVS